MGNYAQYPVTNHNGKEYEKMYRDFPGGPVAKTLCSQCRGPRFDSWLGY